jgi:hypothetical protein
MSLLSQEKQRSEEMDDKFKDLCDRAVSANFSEREKPTKKEISRNKEDLNRRGMFYSSVTVKKVQEYLENELDVQARIIWHTIVRILSILGIHDIKQDVLTATFNEYLEAQYQTLEALLTKESLVAKMPRISSLSDKKTQIQRKQEVEIELFVEGIRRKDSDMQTETPKNSFSFYGNIGAVQTGSYSSAILVQNISNDNKDEICRLLSQVRDSITSLQESNSVQKDELVEILNICLDEVKNQKPNSTKIKTLLTGVAETIQTTASLVPAYQAMKTVLYYFGICLP